ncbi:hypothetical protein TrVE_jg12746 [Triparma verrucosa]|uniref:Uncharacterized protein n=1 Tax=Triparma verrucosa TaxID=1606542 RepID=A0A9W7BSF2_9STRA|nr:hypothetical protein TrVE_jg12746 [Triparma verrucosa]
MPLPLSSVMGVSDPANSMAGDAEAGGTKYLKQRNETVFYNSAKAKRSICGWWHYSISCPGWTKTTDKRFVYSRWEWAKCCGINYPSGRALDTFDSDIVVDMSAHQTCFQICRGEGDLAVFRLEGGDLSDNDEVFYVTDVPNVYEVYSTMTFELAKMNLRDAAAVGLGTRMGAVAWSHDARSGAEGPATIEPGRELVFYNSVTAKRTLLGRLLHLDCCLPPVYKLTSERIMYVDWDVWHPCDAPITNCLLLPFYASRACLKDCCCGFSGSTGENATAALKRRQDNLEKDKTRNFVNKHCACPVGRTANFIDIDLVMDVGAHQRLAQLPLNEGDLILYLMDGDASIAAEGTGNKFYVKSVPEVFSLFDDLSYDLSNLDLTHFRQNAITQEIMRR